jgi:hypothetical protein
LTLLMKTKQGPWSWKRLRCRKFKRVFFICEANYDALWCIMMLRCFKQPFCSFSGHTKVISFHGGGSSTEPQEFQNVAMGILSSQLRKTTQAEFCEVTWEYVRYEWDKCENYWKLGGELRLTKKHFDLKKNEQSVRTDSLFVLFCRRPNSECCTSVRGDPFRSFRSSRSSPTVVQQSLE